MSQEASVVARRLANYFETQHDRAAKKPTAKQVKAKPVANDEKGVFHTALVIALMSVAIFLTKTTLVLTTWIRKLEA